MMNPQIKFLASHGLLASLTTLILSHLTTSMESSHQIKLKLQNQPEILQLQTFLAPYQSSGFKEPASFIGAVCSGLAKRGVIKHGMLVCPITNVFNDAFSLKIIEEEF